jgi:predicted nucleic acid-binding protein
MSAKRFFDTNVLVYACDATDPAKQAAALKCIADAATDGSGALSVQVFGEFFHATVVRKRLLSGDEAERAIRAYQPVFTVVALDFELVCDAMSLHRRYQLRYWDSLILAAARRAGCAEALSEDLNDGQDYDGVVVINPFRQTVE